jgi:cell division initiation protein
MESQDLTTENTEEESFKYSENSMNSVDALDNMVAFNNADFTRGGMTMSNGIRVTPIDIQQKRFHVVFRGYERTEVEMFLDLVRDEMEALVREVAELRDFRQSYDLRVRELNEREETVKNALLLTQRLMEDQKDSANRAAEAIIKEAEVRRLQLLNNAQDEKAKLDVDIQELMRRKHHFLQDIKKVIEMHREMVTFEETGGEKVNEQGQA